MTNRIMLRLLTLATIVVLCTCKGSGRAERTRVKGKIAMLTTQLSRAQRVEDMAAQVHTFHPVSFKPASWPQGVAWRPLRYSGPFTSGSDLEEMQIVLQGTSGKVYYNNLFLNHPSAAIYKLYYRTNWGTGGSFASTALPNNVTPALPARRVPPPGTDGANSILMELKRIEYSSRYGGTVRLVFEMANYATPNNQSHADDFDFEFREGDYLFDVSGLEMSIFEYPLPTSFNPTVQLPFATGVQQPYVGTEQVEFTNGDVAAYKYVADKVVPVAYDDAARAALSAVETRVAAGVPDKYVNISNAQRFSLGFLHDQFQSLFQSLSDPTDGGEKLWLTDNFADLTTKNRTAVFSLYFGLDNITTVDDDMEFWATNAHLYRSISDDDPIPIQSYPDNYGLGWAYVIRPIKGTSIPWIHLGTWNASDCSQLVGDSVQVRLVDPGFFSSTDYGYAEFKVTFDCGTIGQLAQQGEWGNADEVSEWVVLEELHPSDPPIIPSYHAILMARARARVVLSTR